MTTTTAMHVNVATPTIRTTMSNGNRDRARALREYKRHRATARHALAIAERYEHRLTLDTAMHLRDEADEHFQIADELDRDWNFTGRHGDSAAIA